MPSKREWVGDLLRERIRTGVYEHYLPSRNELARELQVSTLTVTNALKDLVVEGLITMRPRRRTEIRRVERYPWELTSYETGKHASPGADPWASQVLALEREPDEKVTVFADRADDDIAEALQVEPGTPVVRRHRWRYVDGQIVQVTDSFFPRELVRGTPLEDPESVHDPRGVLAAIGKPQARIEVAVDANMPSPEQREEFQDLPPSVPAFFVRHIGYHADGTPLRVMDTIAPADRNTLTMKLELQPK
jgi:DNA-binding GntR family transcriptional regulator